MQRKILTEDLDAKITVKDSEENVTRLTDTRAPTSPEETPFRSDDPIADTSARVRLDKHTREPVRHLPNGNPPENPISAAEQLNQWISKSKGRKASPRRTVTPASVARRVANLL